jgi:hypothetical protein
MTKKILDLSISVLLLTIAVMIWFGIYSAKVAGERYFAHLEAQKTIQAEMIAKAQEVQEIITEAGIAFGVVALSEQHIIPPGEAEKMIAASLTRIENRSARLGEIAKYLNEFRLRQYRRR